MQMFVLDKNPAISSRYCCNRHVICICREIAMQLETWYCHHGYPVTIYKPMSPNQPLVEHLDNFDTRQWAIRNCYHLFYEYSRRYKRRHFFFRAFEEFRKFEGFLPYNIEQARFNFVKTRDIILRNLPIDETVSHYRELYKMKKQTIDFRYVLRQEPSWISE